MAERHPFPGNGLTPRSGEIQLLLRGPFVRHDGILVALYQLPEYVTVEFDRCGPCYKNWEVSYLGGYDNDQGLDRIADAYWSVSLEEVRPGTLHLFDSELNAALQ